MSAASDLGLHCLLMSQKWDARLTWVKYQAQDALHDTALIHIILIVENSH